MRVPQPLADAFGAPFEAELSRFLLEGGLIDEEGSLQSDRFLNRSVAPHVRKLSEFFNRLSEDAPSALRGSYWKLSSNPKNLRLAYFLGFMPPNLFRVAGVWSELSRLGYRWPFRSALRAIDFGSGPASAVCGVAAGEAYAPIGLPKDGNWAVLDLDGATLDLGISWSHAYTSFLNSTASAPSWEFRKFARKIEIESLLPPAAPRFQLWTQSFFLNEYESQPASVVADSLLTCWHKHLDDEALVIWVEPALKMESRRLLEVRAALLEKIEKKGLPYQVLLPCLGHQACGALAKPDDWCHEEVMWWRPPYLRKLDAICSLDRKSLPFSYLVLAKTKRPLPELLPALGGQKTERLVSPSHSEGRDSEFFICGTDGKRRARTRTPDDEAQEVQRGDILVGVNSRGDDHALQIEKFRKRI